MLVPVLLAVLVLLAALIGGLYVAKKRALDGERKPDLRPDDRRPTAHVQLD